MYYKLCDDMEPEERAATQRSMGMKMEQLKAELKRVEDAAGVQDVAESHGACPLRGGTRACGEAA